MRHNMGRGMRRGGSNRGSGSNRGPANSRSMNAGNMDSPAPRPLMSSHLQDLDAELALLKLKREIIERQQQILSGGDRFGMQSQYNYDQPQQSYGQRYKESASSSTKNFAHFYKDTSSSQNRQGTKRPAVDVWDRGTSAKRFTTDPPSQYRPPRQRYRPSAGESKPGSWPQGRKDFQPTKVTKPNKAKPPVNKLNSYPVAERKNLVAKAEGTMQKGDPQDIVLRAGREPSRTMTGRMELALGAILKDIREARGDKMPNLSPQALRGVKQAIRERMHVALLNKPVDNVPNIVKAYRAQNPKETDAEVVKTGIASGNTRPSTRYVDPASHKLAMSLFKSGRPDIFFKANFSKLMSLKIDEIFAKVDEQYKKETVTQLMELFMAEADIELFSEVEKEVKANAANANETSADNTKTEESKIDETKADESNTDESKADETKTDDVETNDTKIDDAKTDETNTDDAKTDETKTDGNKVDETKDDEGKVNEETDQVSKDNFIVIDTIGETSGDKNENIIEKDSQNENEKAMDVDNSTESDLSKADLTSVFKIRDYKSRKAHFRTIYYRLVKVMDTMIRRRLSSLLPGYKNRLMSLLDADQEYRNTMAYIIVQTKKKSLERAANVADKADAEGEKSTEKTEKKDGKSLFFIKVFGKPNLPKRKEMQAFLDQYHPATIKKHRGIHNLLFVGFNTQEDYDKILAATDTVIDGCTLDIKESNKAKKDELPENAFENKSENNLELDKELYDLINDLVNSIRETSFSSEKRDKKTQGKRESVKDDSNDDVQIIENNKDVINVDDDQAVEDKQDKDATDEEKNTNDVVEGENETTGNEKETADGDAQLDEDATFVEEENNTAENEAVADEMQTETAKVQENGDKTSGDMLIEEKTGEEKTAVKETVLAKNDNLEAVKNETKDAGGATPTRASGRTATSTPAAPAVRTRRASRLAQNQNN